MTQCLPTSGLVPRNQEDLRHKESLISNFKESEVGPGKSQVLKSSFSIAREGAKYLGKKDIEMKGKTGNIGDLNMEVF